MRLLLKGKFKEFPRSLARGYTSVRSMLRYVAYVVEMHSHTGIVVHLVLRGCISTTQTTLLIVGSTVA